MSYQQCEQTPSFVPQCPRVYIKFKLDKSLIDDMLDCSMICSSFKQKVKRPWQLFCLPFYSKHTLRYGLTFFLCEDSLVSKCVEKVTAVFRRIDKQREYIRSIRRFYLSLSSWPVLCCCLGMQATGALQ